MGKLPIDRFLKKNTIINERSFIYYMADNTPLSRSDRSSLAILDSAYELFTSQGYAATSMRQIAEKSDLALGSIYNHFPSKEALFKAIIETHHPLYLIMPLVLDAEGEGVDEYIRNAARRLVSGLGHHPEFLNLMLTELVEFKGIHLPAVFEKIFPGVLIITSRLEDFQDEIRPFPPPLLMRAFVGLFFSYFITDMMIKDIMPAEMKENALNTFVDIFLNGIKNPLEQFTK